MYLLSDKQAHKLIELVDLKCKKRLTISWINGPCFVYIPRSQTHMDPTNPLATTRSARKRSTVRGHVYISPISYTSAESSTRRAQDIAGASIERTRYNELGACVQVQPDERVAWASHISDMVLVIESKVIACYVRSDQGGWPGDCGISVKLSTNQSSATRKRKKIEENKLTGIFQKDCFPELQ